MSTPATKPARRGRINSRIRANLAKPAELAARALSQLGDAPTPANAAKPGELAERTNNAA